MVEESTPSDKPKEFKVIGGLGTPLNTLNPLDSLKTLGCLGETFKVVDSISKGLRFYEPVSTTVCINMLTIGLKKQPHVHDNSNLLIVPKGRGKTTLLHHILAESNPKYIISLPDKLFETDIVEFPKDHFDNKVWVLDDLITTFQGTSPKQREQLIGFHNSFLSKGVYERKRGDRMVEGRIVCTYGIAKENYSKYSKDMFISTFTDRLPPLTYGFSPEEKDTILREDNYLSKLPKVRLPFKRTLTEVIIPDTLQEEIIAAAKRLEAASGFTDIRAKHYVQNFLKSNANLNHRTNVQEEDFWLWKWVEPLHYSQKPDTCETDIVNYILSKATINEPCIGREIKNVFGDKYSEQHISTTLSRLRENSRVSAKKISLTRGYDYEYRI